MLHPVFSFFNGCEGVGGCMYGCLPCCKTRPKGAARRTGTSCQATAATKSCTHPKKLRKAGASCQATAATKTCTHPKGSAKRDLYAKPTASRETAQLWGSCVAREARSPKGGLILLAVSRMYKSRFAEHAATTLPHPQLRRFTACSGFRIEVYLRHTPCTLNYCFPIVRHFYRISSNLGL